MKEEMIIMEVILDLLKNKEIKGLKQTHQLAQIWEKHLIKCQFQQKTVLLINADLLH